MYRRKQFANFSISETIQERNSSWKMRKTREKSFVVACHILESFVLFFIPFFVTAKHFSSCFFPSTFLSPYVIEIIMSNSLAETPHGENIIESLQRPYRSRCVVLRKIIFVWKWIARFDLKSSVNLATFSFIIERYVDALSERDSQLERKLLRNTDTNENGHVSMRDCK